MSFLCAVETLRRMKTDEDRAQWLASAPYTFFAPTQPQVIEGVLRDSGFEAGLIYFRDETDFLRVRRSLRGDVPFTFGMRRNMSLLTMLNSKSWRA